MARVDVEITHPDRVLFPADGITKRDLATYYDQVADTMLAHLRAGPSTCSAIPAASPKQGSSNRISPIRYQTG